MYEIHIIYYAFIIIFHFIIIVYYVNITAHVKTPSTQAHLLQLAAREGPTSLRRNVFSL